MWLKILIPCVLTFFLGIIAHAFIIPWCNDYYKSTRFAEIELLTVSNTTLEPLKGYSDKDYYNCFECGSSKRNGKILTLKDYRDGGDSE